MQDIIKKITRRVLMFGLGGSGQIVAAKVKEQAGDMPTFAMRVYDTDIQSKYADRLYSCLIQADMARAELIRTHPEEFPHIARILELEKIPPLTNTEGTGQFISQGELLFIASLPQFINHIQAAARPLLSATLPNKVREFNAEIADDRLYVFTVRSAAGGTGSGPNVLLPALLRRELLSLLGMSQRLMLVDIVIMPEPFLAHVEDKKKVLANAGVFFHMMNEYGRPNSEPRVLEFGEDPRYHITVGGGPAADITFLLSNRNLSADTDRGSSVLSLEDIYDMAARFIAHHLTSPMISDYYAAFGNIQQEAREPIFGRPGVLSSFGYCEVIFKNKTVQDWLVLKSTQACLRTMLHGGVQC